MALTKPVQNLAAVSATPATDAVAAVKPVAPSFESMDETTASAPAANEPTAAEPAAPAAAVDVPVSVVTAIVPVAAAALAVRAEASAFQKEVEAMKGAADFAYGNYDVFKGIQGQIQGTGDNKVKLGLWVKVSMIAWDDRVQISPGSEAPAAKDAVAYSKDGVTIDSVIGKESKYAAFVGKKVTDYLDFLRANDWVKASSSRYIDVACVVHDGDKAAAKELAGEVICISLSKSSIPSFASYQEKLNIKAKAVARGIPGVVVPADPFNFYFIAEPAERGDTQWTKLKVSDKLKLAE